MAGHPAYAEAFYLLSPDRQPPVPASSARPPGAGLHQEGIRRIAALPGDTDNSAFRLGACLGLALNNERPPSLRATSPVTQRPHSAPATAPPRRPLRPRSPST